MHVNSPRQLEQVAFQLIKQAVIYLPADVKTALNHAAHQETNPTAKTQLQTILANIELAEKQQVPLCQDTGTLTFYVKAGANAKGLDQVESALTAAVKRATAEIPLRPNAVNPFTQKNSGDNTGRQIPAIHWEIGGGNCLEVTVLPKGGGSENVSALGMLVAGEGVLGLKRFVLDAIVGAGAQPCPPTIVGVGVGGGADVALDLAKRALLRPLGQPSEDVGIAKLEAELFEAANSLGIGPMGLGGKTTVLGVHVNWAFRHPASFPVAVAFNCWAARRASARISGEGKVEYLTHKEV
jgi:fumarate hydratase subunit alpha